MSNEFEDIDNEPKEFQSEILDIEQPELDKEPDFIKLQEEVAAMYRYAWSWDRYSEDPNPPLPTAMVDKLEELIVAVRADERKRADYDHEIGKLNEMVLTDEEFETALMSHEEILEWRKKNPDKVTKKDKE